MRNQGCRPDEILALRPEDVDVEQSLLTIRDGKSHAARRRLKLMAESLRICARRVALGTPWLFPGKLPGTRVVKVNGSHGRVLDDLVVCAARTGATSTKKERALAAVRSSQSSLGSRS